VRLTRTNNTFSAYYSTNGSTWTAVGSAVTFSSMGAGAYVGLVVCSSDNGFLNTSVLDNVSSSFLPANTAPMLTAIPNQTVNPGQTVATNANASDSDSPPSVLTFSLLAAPANATLTKNSSNCAVFSWRPLVTDANTTNVVTVKVADNAIPSLSATQSFQVMVNPLTYPSMTAPVWSNGQISLSVAGQTGPDYAVQATTNLIGWSTVLITNSPPVPFRFVDTNASAFPMQFYRLKAGPPF
jgi:hypothetical protein